MRYKDITDYEGDHDWQTIHELWEQYAQEEENKPTNRPGGLKRKAATYLGTGVSPNQLSKTELRQLLAKARKMKKSTKKEERARGIQLEKQVRMAFNFHK
jgi:hypothetical protein